MSGPAPAAAPAPGPAIEPLIEELTDRELEVLRLLARGMSNAEIAADLVVSVATVKWHVRNILGKLGVTRRTQALVRAQGLGLA
jgi:ATP/maltotriose-dependent transcriptional regulator MalT